MTIVKIIGESELHSSEIKVQLPKHFNHNKLFFEIMNELEDENVIEEKDGNYKKRFPRVMEFINSIEDERARNILLKRINGKTLELIALDYNITRERVRQIEMKSLKLRSRLREDDYRVLFEEYEWEEESFRKAFRENLYTYNYLNLLYKKGDKKIEQMLTDDTIPLVIRQNVEKYCDRNYILLAGEKIRKNSTDLLNYVLKSQCKEDTTIEQLKENYKKLLVDESLDENLFGLEDRYFENKVTIMSNVLWKMGRKLRYYEVFEIDIFDFLKQIDLFRFKDIEISTKLILDEYPDVMLEYDIRDEYELHNLLKKRESELEEYNICFGKMPMISFGIACRDIQVLNLLIEEAPVSNHALALRYQQEFGVKASTVLANYFKCIDEYFLNGIFDIEVEEIPSNEVDVLRNVLKNDIYLVYEVKKIYQEYFPEGNPSRLSSYVYKKLGFKMSVNILFSNRFTSAEKCFREYLTKADIINLSDSQSKYTINQTFYSVLQTLKNELTLIEFEQNQYIKIDKMIEKEISKEGLLDYGKVVEEFIGNRLFTIQSLRKNGFVHELDDLGFGDIFYESLLKANSRFEQKRISNKCLFGLRGLNVSVPNLIKTIINKYQSYDIYDLIDYLYDKYGMKIEKHKIIAWINESELFYSSTMEKVYIDYDEFYKEI